MFMVDKTDGRAFLPYVIEKIEKRISEIDSSLEAGLKEIEGMHEYYWENYTEMDQYGYENYDNQQALLTQINANQEEQTRRRRFRKMLDSPFFGRVDFCYQGEDRPDIFYIGIGNFAERTGQIPLIYDWRAPISSLFYDYDKGPASYEAPAGSHSGEITSKWQYKIRRRKMIYAFESDFKIDDEILGEELGKNGETRLKNIIRTIQREQNAIIRNTKDKILVIQGAAGSGKTSIALHRIAYLLYHERANLKSSQVLVLSPNSVFSDYISRILPELGEEAIQEMSFDLFAYRQLQDVVSDCEDRYDLIERMLADPAVRETVARKQSEEFLNELERYELDLEDALMNFRDVEYRGFVLKESEIIELFYYNFADIPLLSRMEAVAEYFIDEVETLRNRDLPEEERELLTEKFLQLYETRDLYLLYSRFLQETGFSPLPKVSLDKRKLSYEDVYPMLYLKYAWFRLQANHQIRHLVVDEMQDYSRLQYLILKRIFPCKMTILGDYAQTMDEERQDVFRFLPKVFGKNIRMMEMKKSYRNTVEIATYANAIAGITDMELFERHGKPVEEFWPDTFYQAMEQIVSRLSLKMEAQGEEVPGNSIDTAGEKNVAAGTAEKETVLSDRSFETAAVILRTEEEAALAAEYLKKLLDASGFDTEGKFTCLDRDSSAFCRGLTVTTFYLAKGLEFDQVFSVFGKQDGSLLVTQARYIAATRALHELFVFYL